MRKTSRTFICSFLIAALLLTTNNATALAASPANISLDGKIVFYHDGSGYPFTDKNSRVLVPFRITLEEFGASVTWDPATMTAIAEKNGVRVEAPLGARYIIKNGQRIENDTEAVIKNNRVYLPIRKVLEAFGATVSWNGQTGTVIVETMLHKNPSIVYFNIPKALEETRLTKEEVDALVGKSPEVLQDRIDTVYDLLQYMKSAGYKVISGDIKTQSGGYTWHSNTDGVTAIKANEGNCGATSNLANYILKGDYQEVGFMTFSADTGQGGHIFNYIKKDNKYYLIDFLQFAMKGYQSINYKVREYAALSSANSDLISSYGNNGEKYQIKIIVSYLADTQLPIGANSTDRVMRFFPIGSQVNVLYETSSEGKNVEYAQP